jgi:hypothetical protein
LVKKALFRKKVMAYLSIYKKRNLILRPYQLTKKEDMYTLSAFPVNKCDSDLLWEAGGTIFAERASRI